MQRIVVKKFDPLIDVKIDISNIVVLIGESASGKSTLAKLVYFFTRLKDEIFTTIRFSDLDIENRGIDDFTLNISQEIFDKYKGLFGEDLIIDSSVTATYGKGNNENSPSQFKVCFSSETENKSIKYFYGSLIDVIKKIVTENDIVLNNLKLSQTKKDNSAKEHYEKQLQNNINCFFFDQTTSIYIPAGRSFTSWLNEKMKLNFYSTLSDVVKSHSIGKHGYLDYKIMLDFINHVSVVKDRFRNESIESYLNSNFLITKDNNDNYNPIINELIKEILHGSYKNDNDSEFILLENGKKIPLENSSSGQQEVIRIIQEIVERKTSFRVIEEPEAHLFPTAQKQLVEMISVLSKLTTDNNNDEYNSKIVITTHSPYILAAFNNLLFAEKIGIENERIKPLMWINQNQLKAYKMEKGKAVDIFDYELGLIKNEEIDEASNIINKEYDFIENLK